MELFDAIKERRSCRAFLPEAVRDEEIVKVLEAANWAPSPLNSQPWRFLVITGADLKARIYDEAERCRKWALGAERLEMARSISAGLPENRADHDCGHRGPEEVRGGSVHGGWPCGLSTRLCRSHPKHPSCGPCAGTGNVVVHPLRQEDVGRDPGRRPWRGRVGARSDGQTRSPTGAGAQEGRQGQDHLPPLGAQWIGRYPCFRVKPHGR